MNQTQPRSRTVMLGVIPVLAIGVVLLAGSDLGNGIRYGVGGLLAAGLVALAFVLGRQQRANQ